MKTFSALTLVWTGSMLTACATASPRPNEPVAPVESTGPAEPESEGPLRAAQPEPPSLPPTAREPSPPRLPIVLITPMQDGHASTARLSTLVPGEKPSPLRVRLGQECSETMGIGSSSPVVSPDGRFIAFNDLRKGADFRGELVVASLTDKEPVIETLTQHKGDLDVCVQITGWSADGQRLLYHVADDLSEESEPVKGLVKGFFLWERGTKPVHLGWLSSADLFTPDGQSVLQVVQNEGAQGRSLRRITLSDQASVLLATRPDPYAFGQLHVVDDLLAFSTRETLEVAPLAGLAAAKPLVKRPFAEAQWPRLSPDGRHLAWEDSPRKNGVPQPALRVTPASGGEPLDLGALAGSARIEFEWFDDTRLLVCDGQGVRLVALDGASEPLAGPGTCFVPRGAR